MILILAKQAQVYSIFILKICLLVYIFIDPVLRLLRQGKMLNLVLKVLKVLILSTLLYNK